METTTFEAAKRGDSDALQDLFSYIHKRAAGWCRRWQRLATSDADDVAQQVAIRIWKGLEDLDFEDLDYRIRREARNQRRLLEKIERADCRNPSRLVALVCDLSDSGPDPSDMAVAREALVRLQSSPVHGPILVHLANGGTTKSLGEDYGLSYTAAAGRIKRARSFAKNILEARLS